MTPFGSRDRRALMVGAASIAVVLAFGRGMPSLMRRTTASQQEAAEMRAELARARGDLADSASLAGEVNRARSAWSSYESSAIDAPTLASAAGTLGAIISVAAEEAGLAVGSMSMSLDTSDARVSRLSARIQCSGDLSAVAGFLAAIEAGTPALFVPSVAITRSEIGTQAGGPEHLAMDVTVNGFHLASRESRR